MAGQDCVRRSQVRVDVEGRKQPAEQPEQREAGDGRGKQLMLRGRESSLAEATRSSDQRPMLSIRRTPPTRPAIRKRTSPDATGGPSVVASTTSA